MQSAAAVRVAIGMVLTLASAGCSEGTSRVQHFTLRSEITGDVYDVQVLSPEGAGSDPAARLGALYLLDANWNFQTVQNVLIDHRGEMEPVVLVGISAAGATAASSGTTPSRCRDLTPTASSSGPCSVSGGGPEFAAFLATELVPFIDARYPTSAQPERRGLVGGSLGGLFVCYAMLERTDTFGRFLAASPSLWWDDAVLARLEQAYSEEHTSLNATLFVSVGTAEDLEMTQGFAQLTSTLDARPYSGFTLRHVLLEGRSHGAAMAPSFEAGIPWLFPAPSRDAAGRR